MGDLTVALLAVYLGHWLRWTHLGHEVSVREIVEDRGFAVVVFIATMLVALYVADAYSTKRNYRDPIEIARLLVAVLVTIAVQSVIFFSLPGQGWHRGVTLFSGLCFALLLIAWRSLPNFLRPPRGRTAVLGDGPSRKRAIELMHDGPASSGSLELVGVVALNGDRTDGGRDVPLLGEAGEILELVNDHALGVLVVADRRGLSRELSQALLKLKRSGVRIIDLVTLYREVAGQIPVDHVSANWLVFGPELRREDRLNRVILRASDIVLALVGLVVTAPLMLAAAGLVRLSSPGPVIFAQDRVGKDEKPFTLYKLRTMVHNAEVGTGPVWSSGKSDARVTPVGRLLRRARIDELPQLINVLRGEMAIVGPRPEREFFVEQLKQQVNFYELRFAAKPGLTGWAQVCYPYGASSEDALQKLQYELYEIHEMGPLLYLTILLKTVRTVLLRRGS